MYVSYSVSMITKGNLLEQQTNCLVYNTDLIKIFVVAAIEEQS